MIAAADETCGGVVVNQTSVTCPEVLACLPFATPAQTVAGTSTTTIVNPADLYARENIPAQTGLSNDLAAIPAPTASQSNWGTNLLGETLHYMPSVGWKIVADKYHQTINTPVTPGAAGVWGTGLLVVAPRAGLAIISGFVSIISTGTTSSCATAFFKNGVQITQSNMNVAQITGTAANAANIGYTGASDVPAIVQNIAAGDAFSIAAIMTNSAYNFNGFTQITYLN